MRKTTSSFASTQTKSKPHTKNLQAPERSLEISFQTVNAAAVSEPRSGLDDVDAVDLLALPLFALGIKGGVNETLPVFVITCWEVRTIVKTGITRFLTEFNVTNVGLNTPNTVIVFPSTQQVGSRSTGC